MTSNEASGVRRQASGHPEGTRRQASVNLQFAICNLQLAFVCVAIFVATSRAIAADTSEGQREQQRAKLLEQMRGLAQATNVRYQDGDHRPQLLPSPVFRYDDQPRRFIDATMWVWIDEGRPVAFEKIEASVLVGSVWGYCFTSVAEKLLDVDWSNDRHYRFTEPGIDLQPLSDAPPVASRTSERKLQGRKLVREFSARILIDSVNNKSEAMRLLATPIYEYADSKTNSFRGAVFGFTTSGTNPDLLVILEARDEQGDLHWHYAAARMTTGSVTLKYREKTVAEIEFVEPRPTAFPTWTFFSTPRRDIDPISGPLDSEGHASKGGAK